MTSLRAKLHWPEGIQDGVRVDSREDWENEEMFDPSVRFARLPHYIDMHLPYYLYWDEETGFYHTAELVEALKLNLHEKYGLPYISARLRQTYRCLEPYYKAKGISFKLPCYPEHVPSCRQLAAEFPG